MVMFSLAKITLHFITIVKAPILTEDQLILGIFYDVINVFRNRNAQCER